MKLNEIMNNEISEYMTKFFFCTCKFTHDSNLKSKNVYPTCSNPFPLNHSRKLNI